MSRSPEFIDIPRIPRGRAAANFDRIMAGFVMSAGLLAGAPWMSYQHTALYESVETSTREALTFGLVVGVTALVAFLPAIARGMMRPFLANHLGWNVVVIAIAIMAFLAMFWAVEALDLGQVWSWITLGVIALLINLLAMAVVGWVGPSYREVAAGLGAEQRSTEAPPL